MNREYAATEAAKKSRKECRVYVGNLAFGVKWNDLKDFMREGGSQLFTYYHHHHPQLVVQEPVKPSQVELRLCG